MYLFKFYLDKNLAICHFANDAKSYNLLLCLCKTLFVFHFSVVLFHMENDRYIFDDEDVKYSKYVEKNSQQMHQQHFVSNIDIIGHDCSLEFIIPNHKCNQKDCQILYIRPRYLFNPKHYNLFQNCSNLSLLETNKLKCLILQSIERCKLIISISSKKLNFPHETNYWWYF